VVAAIIISLLLMIVGYYTEGPTDPVIAYRRVPGATDDTGTPEFWITKPFNKTLSERGNDLYVATLENTRTFLRFTISFEHTKDESDASIVYAKTVQSAQDSGYETQASKAQLVVMVFHDRPAVVECWMGGKSVDHSLAIAYYYDSQLSAWVIEKRIFREGNDPFSGVLSTSLAVF
jgi:hypothetical protein